eukprot:TRINITY_DN22675_c0_g1_i1.p1 TRINITY_DN22675_c0_g1~~TRINITY_DN22675_c0_g1_i1.p1  ORF type:complete len:732 (+),score=168.97 TRINITY_DN22675_c0_g1_i1:301-2196(+)
MSVLRRGFRMVKGIEAELRTDTPLPTIQMALGTVHLHLCVVLSKLGRHDQAIEEARQGCLAMEEMWRTMYRAKLEADEADLDGDFTKPVPMLRALLSEPPPWLTQAAEVSVQLRQALATEAELLDVPGTVCQFHQRGVYTRSMSDTSLGAGFSATTTASRALGRGQVASNASASMLAAGSPSASSGRFVQDPITGWTSEVPRLHGEAVAMARGLLPADNAVRLRAEKALKQLQERTDQKKEVSFRATTGSFGTRSASSLPSEELPPILQLRSGGRLPGPPTVVAKPPVVNSRNTSPKAEGKMSHNLSLSMDTTASTTFPLGSTMASTWSSGFGSPMASFPGSPGMASTMGASASPGNFDAMGLSWPATSRGDVLTTATTPKNAMLQLSQTRATSPGARRKASKIQEAVAADSQEPQKPPPIPDTFDPVTGEKLDPFRDWILNEMNSTNNLTLRQLMARTEAGQADLKKELKYDAQQFKMLNIKTKEDFALYEGRMYYNDYAYHFKKKNDKKMEDFRKSMDFTLKATDDKCKSWADHYGVQLSKKRGLGLKALHKTLHASMEATPAGIEQKRKAEEAKKQREAEERAARFASLKGPASPAGAEGGEAGEAAGGLGSLFRARRGSYTAKEAEE